MNTTTVIILTIIAVMLLIFLLMFAGKVFMFFLELIEELLDL